MSLLIDVLQEVEQAEQKNNENELDSNDLSHENSSDSSDEWAEEFLPEFAQILEQDSSDAIQSNVESNYYEQAVDEFLNKTRTNLETSPQDLEMSSPLEKESEIGDFSESEEFILPESLEVESSELEQNLEKSITNDVIESTEKDIAEIIIEMDENEDKVKSTEIESESQELVETADSQAIQSESEVLEKDSTEPEIQVEIPDTPDHLKLLENSPYVLSAQTLMASNRANHKKWVYSLLFVMCAGAGWFGFSYYETLIALESGSGLLLSKARNFSVKRPLNRQQNIDEKNQENEIVMSSTESSEHLESLNLEENEADSVDDNIIEEQLEESQSEQISSVIVPAVELPIETTETAFFPPNKNALQKVVQTDNAPANEESKEIEENEAIKIIRGNKPRYLNASLSKAYTAFQYGDDVTAKTAYTEVLRQDVKNRDALLGLAAIALRGNDFQQAQQFYQKVLLYYPQDKVAQVGLVAVQGNQVTTKTESHLKFLLSQSPKTAYIHFSLANFYAQQGRWAEAQQSYFKAFEYDNQRADYAYNLAVSLEHIQQKPVALRYYQQALQLATFQSVSFDIKITEQRVQTLQNNIELGN